jgi:isopentenyl-diphosphate delta-isomerase
MWANSCCSHPVHTPEELEMNPAYRGIKIAAIRRAQTELGITDLQESDLTVGSRILYYADCLDEEMMWAEYELDYIVFAKKDVKLNINPDEVMDSRYVSLDSIDGFLNEVKITPWFQLLR